jgi:hypothetical protein
MVAILMTQRLGFPGAFDVYADFWTLAYQAIDDRRVASPRSTRDGGLMCRSIKTLHNFEPPATEEEIRASALQFVRKLSGFTRPSKVNERAFGRAVEQVTGAVHQLLDTLVTSAPPRDRATEAAKARARGTARYRVLPPNPAG